MKIAVTHGEVGAGAGRDEQDVLTQAAFVSQGLAALGHEPVSIPVSLNLAAAAKTLAELRPAMVFNLVETIAGKGNLIHLFPALLDALKIPYTGAGMEAMFLTSNKLIAKRWLAAAGLPTPAWFTASEMHEALRIEGPWLIKSVWEHASIGLDEDSVLFGADRTRLLAEMDARCETLGGACLAETYIDGREFNLSLLAGEDGPEVLPPAEIRFDGYPPGKVRVVGYRSKWEEGTFEFANTPRTFEFPAQDAPLLSQLKELARRCWKIFDLRGYARVDFRVDGAGRPWILEVNANPCLSPDAGFSAATLRAGLTFPDVLCRILKKEGQPPISAVPPVEQYRELSPFFREEVKPGDRQAVGQLVRATGFFSEEEADIAVELVEERLAKGDASGYFFLLAEEEDRLLGYTCFGPIPGSAHNFDLYWIAVDPGEQGRGIGRTLMAASERIMAGCGAHRLYADTSSRPQYESTRAFYLSCGYVQEAFLADFYAPGDGKVIFVKPLSARSH